MRFLDAPPGGRFALCAVGGYGRRELFPYSDIDLLLLFWHEEDLAGIGGRVEEFLRSLWDSGLRVGHSVRTIAECCTLQQQNVELHISLLDVRFLIGNKEIFDGLAQQLPGFHQRHGPIILRSLVELVHRRHSKFNNTVYHLEPNVKESPGGIRDIHFLHWFSQLAPQHQVIWNSLGELSEAREFLYTLRCFLHLHAGRDNNLLSFELQETAAHSLSAQPVDPAEWMRLYFRNARRVFQSSLRAIEYADAQDSSLVKQFRDWRSRLSTRDFTVSRERVLLRNPAETLRSAGSVLDLLAFAGKHGIQLAWDTQRRISENLPKLERAFHQGARLWPAWLNLLSQPHTAIALRDMQQTGLLAAAISEWQAIDSLVVRDFYHRYTVDEHTFVAIEAVDSLAAPKPASPDRFHQLFLEEESPAALRFALLLHDVGKGTHPGDHICGSLEAAKAALHRFNAPPAIRENVLFLIEHHLDLSAIMNSRDLDDPATARFLTSRVPTPERLRSLVLFTYADISAVNPTALTPWRLEQLWRVYSVGLEQMNRELVLDRVRGDPSQLLRGNVSPQLSRFLEGLPTRYLRTHSREEIEHHSELFVAYERKGAAVEIEHPAGAYLATVLAPDRAGLFASLCGALASFGMNIVKAEAASNAQGCILDLFRFTDPARTLELNPGEVERLRNTMENVIRGDAEVKDLLKRRRSPRVVREAKIAPSVRFNNEASHSATLVEFVGEDRPGLLYDLASAISASGCNIELVMIDTQAHKAIDVFYVTREGGKVDKSAQARLQFDLLRAAEGSR